MVGENFPFKSTAATRLAVAVMAVVWEPSEWADVPQTGSTARHLLFVHSCPLSSNL